MMLGMAASISIAVPSGRRSHTGESSVRNIAMPKLTGIAMTSAMADVAIVPAMGTSAPNCSCTGSHSAVHRNSMPNLRIAGAAPMASVTRIAPSNAKTRSADSRVTLRKTASIRALFRSTGGLGEMSRASGREAAISLLSSTALISVRYRSYVSKNRLARVVGDGLPRSLDLLHDRLGHRHVVELLGHLLAVLVGPVEELEHLAGRIRLLLFR